MLMGSFNWGILHCFQSGGNINNQIGESGRNALHFAADYGQTDVIQCLLEEGADVNVGLQNWHSAPNKKG